MNLRRVICSRWSRDIRPYGRVEVQNLRFNRRFCPYMIQIETRRVSSFTRRSRISLREAEYHAPKVHITCRMAHITWVYRAAINPNLILSPFDAFFVTFAQNPTLSHPQKCDGAKVRRRKKGKNARKQEIVIS